MQIALSRCSDNKLSHSLRSGKEGQCVCVCAHVGVCFVLPEILTLWNLKPNQIYLELTLYPAWCLVYMGRGAQAGVTVTSLPSYTCLALCTFPD